MKSLLIGINSKYIHPNIAIRLLKANTNYDVDLIEFNIKDESKKIYQHIIENDYQLVGFSCYIWNINLIKEVLIKLKDNNITVYGTHLESSISVKEVDKKDKLAVVVGNEAKGVSKEVLDLCDKNIILPMNNDVESLNVSIAAALLMWELK